MSNTHPLSEIHSRLRAADRALARVQGGSSELALVREATGSLLVALHELVGLWERQALAPAGLSAEAPEPAKPAVSRETRPRRVRP